MDKYEGFLEDIQEKIAKKKGARDILIQQLATYKKKRKKLKNKILALERGREVVQEAADETQKELEYRIGGLATLALQSIFDDRYSCSIQFVPRRGKMEADILLEKDGLIMDDIMESSGGGIGDVVSFALRISLWSMKKNRPVFLLDEPFIRVKGEGKQEKCYALLKQLSNELGIQMIIIGEEALMYPCDKEIKIVEGKNTKSILVRRAG